VNHQEINQLLANTRSELTQAGNQTLAGARVISQVRQALATEYVDNLKQISKSPIQGPQAQEPRLTLGRVPVGGEGYYVVYFSENATEIAIALGYYRDSEFRFPSWFPFAITKEYIMASFGPVPGHGLVAAEWHAAGRPT
jgi:hypothetical protein